MVKVLLILVWAFWMRVQRVAIGFYPYLVRGCAFGIIHKACVDNFARCLGSCVSSNLKRLCRSPEREIFCKRIQYLD